MQERLVTSKEMKHLDEYTISHHGIPSLVLMERAALSSVEALHKEGFDLTRVACICGPGNNGGDGIAVCRLLYLAGYSAFILMVGSSEKRSTETKRQLAIAESYGIPILEATPALFDAETAGVNAKHDAPNNKSLASNRTRTVVNGASSNPIYDIQITTVVDAILGIGATRAPSGDFASAIQFMNRIRQNGAKILALDIPSGVSADTGETFGEAVTADVTVTFAYKKIGLTCEPGSRLAGKVLVKDIGIYDQNC